MSIAYYLACMDTHEYVWIGALQPAGQILPDGCSDVISRFALAHRNKPLIVVSDSHPIVSEGTEWESGVTPAV